MHIFSFFTTMPLGEGFGFNGNILETNIINLSVVIGIVVSFGGDALRSLLENRKQIILNNLQQADQRAKEAQEKLQQAKTQLELAKIKLVKFVSKEILLQNKKKNNAFVKLKTILCD